MSNIDPCSSEWVKTFSCKYITLKQKSNSDLAGPCEQLDNAKFNNNMYFVIYKIWLAIRSIEKSGQLRSGKTGKTGKTDVKRGQIG